MNLPSYGVLGRIGSTPAAAAAAAAALRQRGAGSRRPAPTSARAATGSPPAPHGFLPSSCWMVARLQRQVGQQLLELLVVLVAPACSACSASARRSDPRGCRFSSSAARIAGFEHVGDLGRLAAARTRGTALPRQPVAAVVDRRVLGEDVALLLERLLRPWSSRTRTPPAPRCGRCDRDRRRRR